MTGARNFGLLTVVKQAVAGTPASDATGGYAMPIVSGMVGPVKEFADLPRQGSSMTRLGRYAQRAQVGGSVTVMCTPESLGLLLYGAMGSELALGTPANGVTPHTFVMADEWPTQFTVWASLASGSNADVWRFADAQISRLQIQGSSGENLMVEVEFVAKHYTKTGSTQPTGAAVEDAEPRFKYIGSQVLMDSDSAVPVLMDNVESFTFEVNRDAEVRYGASLTPSVFAPDRMVNFSAEVLYDSASAAWDFIEDAYLLALNGDPDQTTPTGSFDVTAGVHPTGSFETLRIVSGGGATLPGTVAIQQNWEYGVNRPDASGDPALITYTLDGVMAAPAAGTTEVTVVLESQMATLYSA